MDDHDEHHTAPEQKRKNTQINKTVLLAIDRNKRTTIQYSNTNLTLANDNNKEKTVKHLREKNTLQKKHQRNK
jgi:hypothetical protein